MAVYALVAGGMADIVSKSRVLWPMLTIRHSIPSFRIESILPANSSCSLMLWYGAYKN